MQSPTHESAPAVFEKQLHLLQFEGCWHAETCMCVLLHLSCNFLVHFTQCFCFRITTSVDRGLFAHGNRRKYPWKYTDYIATCCTQRNSCTLHCYRLRLLHPAGLQGALSDRADLLWQKVMVMPPLLCVAFLCPNIRPSRGHSEGF